MVTFSIFDLSLSLSFFHFFWEISSWGNVNLVLNHTILSFKVKKLLITYLSPLIFLNYKKQTHKLNPKKRLVDRVGFEPTILLLYLHVTLSISTLFLLLPYKDKTNFCKNQNFFIFFLSRYEESNPIILCTKQAHHLLCFTGLWQSIFFK